MRICRRPKWVPGPARPGTLPQAGLQRRPLVLEEAEQYLENAKNCMDAGQHDRAGLWLELAKTEALLSLASNLDAIVQPPDSEVDFVLHTETGIIN